MTYCISASPEARELAERVALITLAMCEALGRHPEAYLPGRYRYHLYGGFPGFADHALCAALQLHHALGPYDIECTIDIAHDYASALIDADVHLESPAPSATLTALSEAALRKPLSTGNVVLRKCGEPEFCNYDDARG